MRAVKLGTISSIPECVEKHVGVSLQPRMKFKAIVLATLILFSCDDLVRFEVPQPEGQSNEKRIPKRLIGQYLSLDDSAQLSITPGLVIKYSVSNYSGIVDSADMKNINGDTTYSRIEENFKFDVVVRGDSTFQRWSYYDTLFDATRGDILRKFKGYYFLNEQLATNSWRVTILTKIKSGLTLGTVSTKEDINNLRTLTETQSDSVFNFRPTKLEMKRFLKGKGFSDRDIFLKID